MYRTFETIIRITLIASLTIFIIIAMYILNSMINNLAIISIGLVVVLTLFSFYLLRGTIGLLLFGFFVITAIVSIVLNSINDGIFYGSVIMAFLVIANIFKQYSSPD